MDIRLRRRGPHHQPARSSYSWVARGLVAGPLFAACGDGPADETLVDELRIVAAVASPPELAPGEWVQLGAEVVLASAEEADMIVWLCTPDADGCVEDAMPLYERLASVELVTGQARLTLRAPDLGVDDGAPFTAWMLACTPGTCPIISEARTALNLDTDLPDALRAPNALLRDLPTEGVSLAQRHIVSSQRPLEERNQNPAVRLTGPLVLDLSTDEVLSIPLDVTDDDDALAIVGLATGGGFGPPRFDAPPGPTTLDFYAPSEPGEVQLYIVVEDGQGGSAVWSAAVTVR